MKYIYSIYIYFYKRLFFLVGSLLVSEVCEVDTWGAGLCAGGISEPTPLSTGQCGLCLAGAEVMPIPDSTLVLDVGYVYSYAQSSI